jgi:hypothetical protein
MPEIPYAVLHLHFVFDPEFGLSVTQKAALIGIKRTAYNEALGNAEHFVLAKLDGGLPDAQMKVIALKTITEALRTARISVTKAQTSRTCPSLNLQAMGRPTLRRTP